MSQQNSPQRPRDIVRSLNSKFSMPGQRPRDIIRTSFNAPQVAQQSAQQHTPNKFQRTLMSPGQELVAPGLKKLGVNPGMAAVAGFATDVAIPGPGENTAYLKGGSKVVSGLKDSLSRHLTSNSFMKPEIKGRVMELIDQLGRHTVSASLIDEANKILRK